MFAKKFAATLIMLTQVYQTMPSSHNSISQPVTQPYLEPSISLTFVFQLPPINPKDP